MCVQTEINRQSRLFDTIGRGGAAGAGAGAGGGGGGDGRAPSPPSDDSNVAIDQIVAGLLSIPSIKNKLAQQFGAV